MAESIRGASHLLTQAQRAQEEEVVAQATLRRWAASIRQIVESIFEKLHDTFSAFAESGLTS